jgi:4-diphosphocytidyl-2-C-methyl-D-erythritol kinase
VAHDIRTALVDFAPAKINLNLRIGPRRPDGYHSLESLVVFADIGDALQLRVGEPLSLTVEGETADDAGAVSDNLVLKAARALSAEVPGLRVGGFELEKNLPVAAGVGGGSSDAAAALRLLGHANPDKNLFGDLRMASAARKTGADVPVCLDPRPRIMRGIGELLSPPLHLPKLSAVLVNPRVSAPTASIFAARAKMANSIPYSGGDPATALAERATVQSDAPSADRLIDALHQSGNDLEAPAISLHPIIADVLSVLRALPGCRLARMSGSGATCFGLFEAADVKAAAQTLATKRPDWWIAPTTFG